MLQVWVRVPPTLLKKDTCRLSSERINIFMVNGKAGKGDSYRKVDHKKYSESWDRIFGKKQGEKTNERKHKSGKDDNGRNTHN